jgi:hypothetical protein
MSAYFGKLNLTSSLIADAEKGCPVGSGAVVYGFAERAPPAFDLSADRAGGAEDETVEEHVKR